MALILDGTNVLSDVDGTAGTPAIRGSDANTGIFFPAADTIAFSEGGTEVARFDTAGTSHEAYNKGMKWTAEQRAAQSERLKGRVVSAETRMKIRLAQAGRPVPEERRLKLVGKKASEATRQKLREAHLGQAAWNKGLTFSDEAKAKMSAAKIGKTPWNKGRPFSEEAKRKMSEAAKKRC